MGRGVHRAMRERPFVLLKKAKTFRTLRPMKLRFVAVLLAAAWCLGCHQQSKPAPGDGSASSAGGAPASQAGSTAPAAPAAPSPAAAAGRAQSGMQRIKLFLGPKELNTELALTDQQRMTGMMFRTNVPENEAMLFAFPIPHRTAFWMKNVPMDISAAYIDPDGIILEIHKLEANNTNSVPASTDRVQYVLETAEGWFARNGVNTGAVVRTERGSLAETFRWRR